MMMMMMITMMMVDEGDNDNEYGLGVCMHAFIDDDNDSFFTYAIIISHLISLLPLPSFPFISLCTISYSPVKRLSI